MDPEDILVYIYEMFYFTSRDETLLESSDPGDFDIAINSGLMAEYILNAYESMYPM